jgi:hypothetical protein
MTREEKIKRMVQQMIDNGVTTDREQARATVLRELEKPGGEEWLDRNLEREIDTQGFDKIGQGDERTNEQKLEKFERELTAGEYPDFLPDIEENKFEEWRDRFADPEETEEDRLERQIDYFNSLRDHVSDSDMGYMQQQDPESLYSQGRDVDNTMIVEALQRRAMEQGNVGATAGLPIGPVSDQGLQGIQGSPGVYNENPIAEAAQVLGQRQQQDPAQLEAIAQQEALRRIQMQGAFAQGIGGLPGMTRYPGLGGNKGYTGGSTPFNPYA